eukprot:scaffold938_cov334-Pavlova_lutheri.AAC.45
MDVDMARAWLVRIAAKLSASADPSLVAPCPIEERPTVFAVFDRGWSEEGWGGIGRTVGGEGTSGGTLLSGPRGPFSILVGETRGEWNGLRTVHGGGAGPWLPHRPTDRDGRPPPPGLPEPYLTVFLRSTLQHPHKRQSIPHRSMETAWTVEIPLSTRSWHRGMDADASRASGREAAPAPCSTRTCLPLWWWD